MQPESESCEAPYWMQTPNLFFLHSFFGGVLVFEEVVVPFGVAVGLADTVGFGGVPPPVAPGAAVVFTGCGTAGVGVGVGATSAVALVVAETAGGAVSPCELAVLGAAAPVEPGATAGWDALCAIEVSTTVPRLDVKRQTATAAMDARSATPMDATTRLSRPLLGGAETGTGVGTGAASRRCVRAMGACCAMGGCCANASGSAFIGRVACMRDLGDAGAPIPEEELRGGGALIPGEETGAGGAGGTGSDAAATSAACCG